jgi:hypothetical protein
MWRDKYRNIFGQRPLKVNEILSAGIHFQVTACPAGVMTIAKTAEKAPFNRLDITRLAWKAMRLQANGG